MHEEVNQKVVSLCVRSAKMSATELEKVLKMFLDAQKQKKNQFATVRLNEKTGRMPE